MRTVTIPIPNHVWGPERKNEVTFLVGQNAKDNHEIIDMASPTDMWMHVRRYSSCHVVAIVPTEVLEIDDKRKRRDILRSITKQGSVLCKRFSKHKSEKNVEIMATQIKNVEKTSVAGEVMTRGDYSVMVI